jgi:glycosyltransferase involved in cell wall biosynthesis
MGVGRIDAQKNQLMLVKAFARFHKREPEARLVLLGPETQPEYAARIRATIAAHDLGARVSLLPGLRNDDPELVNAYHACDVFVLPSMHEAFGIVVLEAWSAGKPVVVNHVGGLKALVREGQNGLFIDAEKAGTAEALAARLSALQANPALRQHLGHAGRSEAFSRYDWSRIAKELERHYQAAENHADLRYGAGRR